MEVVIAAAVVAIAVVAGALLARLILRRSGTIEAGKPVPPRVWVVFLGLALFAVVVVSAFASGHPLVGIAIAVAVLVVPWLVLLPFIIRLSRRLADEARMRRRDGG
jgi:hypothetical protein